jgi:gamma-glutamyltranspeptidase/glutathione hydrolase
MRRLPFPVLPTLRPSTTVLACLLLLLLSGCQSTPDQPATPPARSAVASAHPLATQAGLDMLARGGNAFDAAVAVASTLAVVEPYSAGMGGGGFWLLHVASERRDVFVDAREVAPLSATRNMYLDRAGNPVPGASTDGPLAAGIPGQAAAFAHLATRYGRLPLATTLAPSIDLARKGFPAHRIYLDMVGFRRQALQRFPESRRIFLNDGKPLTEGTLIVQEDLARTLETLAAEGHAGFYQGAVSQRLVSAANAGGAAWSEADLAQYEVVERAPLSFRVRLPATQDTPVRQAIITTAPPPSAGGIALQQMFSMMALLPPAAPGGVTDTHLRTEVMRRAYRDRALYLGDPGFTDIPLAMLTSHAHAAQWVNGIHPDKASRSAQLGRLMDMRQGFHTTHFSIVDAAGNRVAATLSINLPFGSAFTAAGTGVLLNNEMDDFSLKVGAPNAYGLVGSEANSIAPGKRPLSSMTPTFMQYEREGTPHLAVVGTPGGSRIISMVFLALLEALDNKPVEAWVARPRFHHQYLPDEIQYEPGALTPDALRALGRLGHTMTPVGRPYGNMQALDVNLSDGTVRGASDPRGMGRAAGQ